MMQIGSKKRTSVYTLEKKRNKRLQVAFTHARVHMGASAYSPGPEESWRRLIWFVEILVN